MNNKSFWWYKGAQEYPQLKTDVQTDVAVIGGGLAGIFCAYELADRGYSVCVLEAGRIGCGETANSSAMVTVAHDIIYSRLIKKHGKEVAAKYLELNKNGGERIKELIGQNEIDCDYRQSDFVLYAQTEKGEKEILKERKAYHSLGTDTELSFQSGLPFPVNAALTFSGQAHLNPFKFVQELCAAAVKKGVMVFENTPVRETPEKNSLKVGDFTVAAKHFVIATNFPYLILPGFYFAKMYRHRSHNIIFESNFKPSQMFESADDDGFEYRPAGQYTLCGGANIRTGKYAHESQYKIVEQDLKENLGVDEDAIVSKFSAQDCMTLDMMPLVGKYSNFLDNVYIISGFNKWGFTSSAAASQIIADLIGGKNTDYNIFDPMRPYLIKAPLNAAANLGEVAANFANLVISADAKKFERIKKEQGAVVRHKGKRVGVYRDGNGKMHTVLAVCTHMGCALAWNKDELSWDCPCHGSRFDIDGKVLSGPSVDNLEIPWHTDNNLNG